MSDNSTGEKFREFYEMLWLAEDVYSQSDFVNYFHIDSRLARYHLLRMCDQGLLCQISYKGNAWYIHHTHKELFKSDLTLKRKGIHIYPR
jgi:hypothetical protein